MDFLLFIKRYFFFILLLALTGLAIGHAASVKFSGTSYKGTLFLTVANKAAAYPDQMETAGNFFGETLVGWFRNPVFTENIVKEAGDISGSFSASKQERQNILVEIKSRSASDTEKLLKSTLMVVKRSVEKYNEDTKGEFVVLNQGGKIESVQGKQIFFPLGGLILGIFVSLVLLLIKEGMLVQVSSLYEIKEILGRGAIDILPRRLQKKNIVPLYTALQKMMPLVILSGVGVNTNTLVKSLALYFESQKQNLIIADGDLENRNLDQVLEVSSSIKHIKGHTDGYVSKEEVIEPKVLIQNTQYEHLFFIGAGKGSRFLPNLFPKIAEIEKTIVVSSIPENYEVLSLTNASLLLVIKLGKTSLKDLKRVRQIWEGKILYVVVN